jgi:hypothetical protein
LRNIVALAIAAPPCGSAFAVINSRTFPRCCEFRSPASAAASRIHGRADGGDVEWLVNVVARPEPNACRIVSVVSNAVIMMVARLQTATVPAPRCGTGHADVQNRHVKIIFLR